LNDNKKIIFSTKKKLRNFGAVFLIFLVGYWIFFYLLLKRKKTEKIIDL